MTRSGATKPRRDRKVIRRGHGVLFRPGRLAQSTTMPSPSAVSLCHGEADSAPSQSSGQKGAGRGLPDPMASPGAGQACGERLSFLFAATLPAPSPTTRRRPASLGAGPAWCRLHHPRMVAAIPTLRPRRDRRSSKRRGRVVEVRAPLAQATIAGSSTRLGASESPWHSASLDAPARIDAARASGVASHEPVVAPEVFWTVQPVPMRLCVVHVSRRRVGLARTLRRLVLWPTPEGLLPRDVTPTPIVAGYGRAAAPPQDAACFVDDESP